MEDANSDLPLVLVGHSMGGLVIKKAYILGHQSATFQPVVRRIRAVFFLATPHQGADIANILSRILSLAPGSRPFVNDLLPQSPTLQAINAEFPQYSKDLHLFSFFETLAMNYVIGKGLIVEKHCAVMNYANERRTHLDANHRDVARFSSPADSNYLAVRNALATFLGAQRRKTASAMEQVEQEKERAVTKYLVARTIGADDVSTQNTRRVQGTGVWLLERQSFKLWRDAYSSSFMWLRGRPGTGKSFLAGNVVNHLRWLGHDCCSYFFTSTETTKSSLNAFLQSMAYQMSIIHPEVLNMISHLSTGQDTLADMTDCNAVWRQVYLSGILKIKMNKPQYWVLDALDECKGAAELISFVSRAQEAWPLCIFVTSRESIESLANRPNHSIEVVAETISETDSQQDISLLLQANIHRLKGATQEFRVAIAAEVVERSKGSFLWANLTLKDLMQAPTTTEMRKVLERNPRGMTQLYYNILDSMSTAKYGKDLAKAILTWACCSFKLLSTVDLQTVLLLQLGEKVEDLESCMALCCGNLVHLDNHQKLQLIHGTAKDFLLNKDIVSEFAVDERVGHGTLAKICLQHLINQSPKSSVRSPGAAFLKRIEAPDRSSFTLYAAEYVFQHISQAKPNNEELVTLLVKFLQSPSILLWIEYVAKRTDLSKVYQAGNSILNLLDRRSQYTPPIGPNHSKQSDVLGSWGNDLLHLITRFGRRLLQSPSSIYHLIPPFCPPASIIRKQFAVPNRGLSVHGIGGTNWNECLTTITYANGARPLSSDTGPGYFGLGMSNGKILIHDDLVFGLAKVLEHHEPVWRVQFSEDGKYFASSGAKAVRVWSTETWEELFKIPMKALALALGFLPDDEVLIIAAKNNTLSYFDLGTGCLREDPIDWAAELAEDGPDLHSRQPTMAALSPHQHLMAVMYRGEDILLWDFVKDYVYDIYEKDTGSRQNPSVKVAGGVTTVRSLAFSAALDTCLLAASYEDGDLVLYDTYIGNVVQGLQFQNIAVLRSSPDGRTLAAADTRGNISLYDFETLRFLYRISFENNFVTSKFLSFTSEGQRLVDVRATQCRVWQPTILLRHDMDQENSDTSSVTTAAQEIDYHEVEGLKITAMLGVKTTGVGKAPVFCGKMDGSVHVFDVSGETHGQQLFVQTAGCPVMEIQFDDQSGFLSCRDVSSRVTCRKLSRLPRAVWEVEEPVLDIRPNVSITQILCSGTQSRLLVSSAEGDKLWGFHSDEPLASLSGSQERRWTDHPKGEWVLCINDSTVEIRSWSQLSCLQIVEMTDLTLTVELTNHFISLQHRRYFATMSDTATTGRKKSPSNIYIWDFQDFHNNAEIAKPVCTLGQLSSSIDVIIGVFGERLIYLDVSQWICSIEIHEPLEVPVRHFFIPNDWLSLVDQLLLDIGKMGEILFVKQSELAVIRRGLETAMSP
ncbi:hypothetical protein ACHAQA_001233 [Verticillium albo-atrum]